MNTLNTLSHRLARMNDGMLRSAAVAAAFWALGLVLAFHPTLLSGGARMQGAPVDTRFNNYVLEHEYRWLASGGRRDLWNAGFFFPVPDTAAFGDVQLAVMPAYAIWRILGWPYDTAFQLWCMAVLSLNFAAFWLFLRRAIGVSPLAAGFGSFLFAFGASRVNQVGHEQLFSQFYVVGALYALYRVFRRDAETARSRAPAVWLGVFFASVVAQLYTGFYFGWFLLFAVLVACLWAAVLPSCRTRLIQMTRSRWLAIATGLGISVVATAPLWSHYLEAAHIVGFREWAKVEPMLPRPQSWVYLGPFSRLYRWQYGLETFRSLAQDQEHRLGIGLATTVIVAMGLYWRRKDRGTRLLLLVAATLALCATSFPVGEWVWRLVFEGVPGANAIRAVARIGMLMLIPAGLGAAYFVDEMRPRRALLALALAACVLEQAQTTPAYDKLAVRSDVASLANRIGSDCDAFLFAPLAGPGAGRSGFEDGKHQLDAMWAELLTGAPTINGRSGNSPPGWNFDHLTMSNEADERRTGRLLGDWCRRWNLDAQRVCWIRSSVDWSWSLPSEPLLHSMLRRWREG